MGVVNCPIPLFPRYRILIEIKPRFPKKGNKSVFLVRAARFNYALEPIKKISVTIVLKVI